MRSLCASETPGGRAGRVAVLTQEEPCSSTGSPEERPHHRMCCVSSDTSVPSLGCRFPPVLQGDGQPGEAPL